MDREGVEAFLIERFGPDVDAVTTLVDGAWSQAFGYRHGNCDLVVRLSALDEDFRKDQQASRHASPDLPIPRILEIGEVGGGFYAISERMFGQVIETVDAAAMRAVLPSLMSALDAMRLADITGTSGYGGWGADGNAPFPSWRAALVDVATDGPAKRHHGWRERLATSPTGDRPFFEAFKQLESLAEDVPDLRHLIHADLVNRNVLVEGDRVTAVFDWGSAMHGDFLFDLARIDFWAPWFPAWREVDVLGTAARHFGAMGLDVPRFETRLRACELYIGLDGQAYQAFKGGWSDLEWTAARTLELARAQRPTS